MTAIATPSTTVRRERRIIERPRLIKLLDESEARTILLLAPAGYGKTTLARQWAKTLNGAIWVTATPAHRDVAVLAESLASGIDQLGGDCGQFVSEYLLARSNPQRAAQDVAALLATHMATQRVQWLVIDDYHELAPSPEVEELVEALHERTSARFLVSSRLRPSWATSRRVLYREIDGITRELLAMDLAESKQVLGRRPDLHDLISRAEGWPAVLGLAVGAGRFHLPGEAMPAALYDYFAEELFRESPLALQQHLIALALTPELSSEALAEQFGDEAHEVIEQARELGFLSVERTVELHPLIREFLLQKLAEDPGAATAVRRAIETCLARERWGRAFELILRFSLLDMVEPVLEAAYKPLSRSGRLGTLSAFAASVRVAPTFPPPIVDLVEAEVAVRDGMFQLAADVAARVQQSLSPEHPLASRASMIIGQSAFIQADLAKAVAEYRLAHENAQDDQDEAEALYGWALASVQGEVGDATWAFSRLNARRHLSPLDLVRHTTAELARRHFAEGFAAELPFDEALHVLPQVEDPRARSSLTAIAAYVCAVCADYGRAAEFMRLTENEIAAFDLDFARPHSKWTLAFTYLGQRKFGAAESALQAVEDLAQRRSVGYHVLNARALRARLALQTGQSDAALRLVRPQDVEAAIPAIHAEYLATRALVLATLSNDDEALDAADAAERLSTAVEVRVLAQTARATIDSRSGNSEQAILLWNMARELGAWDPVVTALRASSKLSELLAGIDQIRPELGELYQRSNDLALARRAGLRTRSLRAPGDVLSPRELEVLQLLVRGFRNRDISLALVISESTTKVHVRHILEKLGVRTRTEAVARCSTFS